MSQSMLHRSLLSALLVCCTGQGLAADDDAIRLWPGKALGSEQWNLPESVTTQPSGDRVLSNVSEPTLTVFLPDPSRATGTAVVIVPGGALRVLSIDNEGTRVARWLNDRGIAAFVLKYRTLPILAGAAPFAPSAPGAEPRREIEIRNANANPEPDNAALAEVLRMAVADAEAAMRLVRSRASEWRVDPSRVGMMGFSAGGGVALALALEGKADVAPAFVATLYGPSLVDVHVRPDLPPLFIAVGARHFNVTSGCLALFDAWRAGGRPVELHVYDQVTAGFGLTPRGLPVDGWIDRFLEWLQARGLQPAASVRQP